MDSQIPLNGYERAASSVASSEYYVSPPMSIVLTQSILTAFLVILIVALSFMPGRFAPYLFKAPAATMWAATVCTAPALLSVIVSIDPPEIPFQRFWAHFWAYLSGNVLLHFSPSVYELVCERVAARRGDWVRISRREPQIDETSQQPPWVLKDIIKTRQKPFQSVESYQEAFLRELDGIKPSDEKEVSHNSNPEDIALAFIYGLHRNRFDEWRQRLSQEWQSAEKPTYSIEKLALEAMEEDRRPQILQTVAPGSLPMKRRLVCLVVAGVFYPTIGLYVFGWLALRLIDYFKL